MNSAIRCDAGVSRALLKLAVIVPVLYECDNIAPLFDLLRKSLTELSWEVIFVDGGSRDGAIDQIDYLAQMHSRVHAIKLIGRTWLSSAVVEGAMATAAPLLP